MNLNREELKNVVIVTIRLTSNVFVSGNGTMASLVCIW